MLMRVWITEVRRENCSYAMLFFALRMNINDINNPRSHGGHVIILRVVCSLVLFELDNNKYGYR